MVSGLGKGQMEALLLLVIVVGGAYYLTNGFKTLSVTQTVPVTQTGGVCDSGTGSTQQPTVSYGGYWLDPTNNMQKTSATTLAQFFVPGEAISRVYTTFIGNNATNAGGLACGQQYNLILGDGGNVTYYYTAVPVPALSRTVVALGQAQLTRAGAPTISMSNATTFEGTTVQISNATIGANTWSTATLKIHVVFPADGTVFGDQGYIACVRFPNGNFSDVSIGGNQGVFNQLAIQGSAANVQVKCFKFPPATNGQVVDLPVSFKGGSSFGAATSQTADVYLADITGVPFNGNLIPGADNSVGTGLATDVGRSNPNLQTAITFRGP